jgi:hypothetical protein
MKEILLILTQVQTPFEPTTTPLDALNEGELPWPTRDDLISMKAFGASKRLDIGKCRNDINDIKLLLATRSGPLLFPGSAEAEANKAFVKGFLPLLSKFGQWTEEEWIRRLGL